VSALPLEPCLQLANEILRWWDILGCPGAAAGLPCYHWGQVFVLNVFFIFHNTLIDLQAFSSLHFSYGKIGYQAG
jgi:hypothetical protein